MSACKEKSNKVKNKFVLSFDPWTLFNFTLLIDYRSISRRVRGPLAQMRDRSIVIFVSL